MLCWLPAVNSFLPLDVVGGVDVVVVRLLLLLWSCGSREGVVVDVKESPFFPSFLPRLLSHPFDFGFFGLFSDWARRG